MYSLKRYIPKTFKHEWTREEAEYICLLSNEQIAAILEGVRLGLLKFQETDQNGLRKETVEALIQEVTSRDEYKKRFKELVKDIGEWRCKIQEQYTTN